MDKSSPDQPSAGFSARCNDVFAGLDGIGFQSGSSLQQTPYQPDQFKKPSSDRSQKFDKFKKTDSIFQEQPDVGSWRKRESSGQQRRRRHNPLYSSRRPERKDPKKYTKYSLADVSDITDSSNAKAAFAFLNQRQKQSNEDLTRPKDDEKIAFKRPPTTTKPKPTKEAEKAPSSMSGGCGNSKRVLPEAVVGQTKAKKPSKTTSVTSKPSSNSKLSLSHLNFEEEDDD